jgi:hypothetical protein
MEKALSNDPDAKPFSREFQFAHGIGPSSSIKAALAGVYGMDTVENKISGYYLADEISGTYRGMMIAIPNEDWIVFRQYPNSKLIKVLKQLAANVRLFAFLKHPRGAKKKVRKHASESSSPPVSTARVIADRKSSTLSP